jgi:hypothetical protein
MHTLLVLVVGFCTQPFHRMWYQLQGPSYTSWMADCLNTQHQSITIDLRSTKLVHNISVVRCGLWLLHICWEVLVPTLTHCKFNTYSTTAHYRILTVVSIMVSDQHSCHESLHSNKSHMLTHLQKDHQPWWVAWACWYSTCITLDKCNMYKKVATWSTWLEIQNSYYRMILF